jgi:hypothetical protein
MGFMHGVAWGSCMRLGFAGVHAWGYMGFMHGAGNTGVHAWDWGSCMGRGFTGAHACLPACLDASHACITVHCTCGTACPSPYHARRHVLPPHPTPPHPTSPHPAPPHAQLWLEGELASAAAADEKCIICSHLCIYPATCSPVCLLWNYQAVLEVCVDG